MQLFENRQVLVFVDVTVGARKGKNLETWCFNFFSLETEESYVKVE